jgi:hypothetical protein
MFNFWDVTILANLHCPLCDPPRWFFALKDTRQRPIEYNPDSMGQKVVLELPVRHKNCVEQLLDFRVPFELP